MRIGLISYAYPYPRRGYWVGIERFAEGLSDAFAHKGLDVTVITSYCSGTKGAEVTPSGVRIYRAKSLPTGLLALNLATFSLHIIKKHIDLLRNMDVLHILSGSFIPIQAVKQKLPPIISYFPHLDRVASLKEFAYLPEVNLILHVLYRNSDLVAAGIPQYSPELTEFLDFFKLNLRKVRFCHEGVDTKKFNSKVPCEDIKEKTGEYMVLYVGPLIPRKGIEYLIMAIPKVLEKIPEAKFIIIGKGPQRQYLERMSKSFRISDHIIFEGFVSEQKLSKYYAAASVFAFPTLREGYPLVCLEAMACGVPVVASKLSTISHMVSDAGILVDPANSDQLANGIIRLLENKSLRIKLGKRGDETVKEKFTWNKIAEEMLKIYREAIDIRRHVI